MGAQEKALLTKIERSKLEIAEFESDLAGFLNQRKQLDAEIAEAGSPAKRAQLVYARSVVSDEVDGAQLLLADARVPHCQQRSPLGLNHPSGGSTDDHGEQAL